MLMCARDIEFDYFYYFSIEFWNCSDRVTFYFVFHSIIGCENIIMMMYRLLLITAALKLQSLKQMIGVRLP